MPFMKPTLSAKFCFVCIYMLFCLPANISTAQKPFFPIQLKDMDIKIRSAKDFMNLGTCQSGCKIKRIVWLVSPCLLQFDNGWSRSESGAGITREKGKENKRIWLIVAFECRDNLHYRIVFKGFLTSKTFSKSSNLWITAGGDALGAASESWNLQPPAVFPSQTHNFGIFLGRCTNTQECTGRFQGEEGFAALQSPLWSV